MDKKFLKKIIAQSSDDLQVISACCSEAKVYTSGIKYLSSNKIFLLSLFRFDKENEASKESINSIIKFEFIESSKSKNIDQKNSDKILELLAIDVFKRNHNFEIRTGYFLSQQEESDLNKKLKEVKNLEGARPSHSPSLTSRLILPSNLNSCGCC